MMDAFQDRCAACWHVSSSLCHRFRDLNASHKLGDPIGEAERVHEFRAIGDGPPSPIIARLMGLEMSSTAFQNMWKKAEANATRLATALVEHGIEPDSPGAPEPEGPPPPPRWHSDGREAGQ